MSEKRMEERKKRSVKGSRRRRKRGRLQGRFAITKERRH